MSSLLRSVFAALVAILLVPVLTCCSGERPDVRYIEALQEIHRIVEARSEDPEAKIEELRSFWGEHAEGVGRARRALAAMDIRKSLALYRRADRIYERIHRGVQAAPALRTDPLVQEIMRTVAP